MINLQFKSEALPEDAFQILQFDGEEEISHLFRFELHLVSRDPDIDFKAVLESRALLEITTQGQTRYVQGMLAEFDQGGEWLSGLYEYRAVLVPRLWMMSQSLQNQIFQQQTVPEILESEIADSEVKGGHPLVMAGLHADDYEIFTMRKYPQREYVVQYKESDLNFISRLMEHEGIYYFFEHDERREKLVITDAMAEGHNAEQPPAVFQTNAEATQYVKSVVYKLNRSQQQIPGKVLIKDFNYRSPNLPMEATGDVAADGIGLVTEFGAHFKSPEEGEELATIRAEEYRCRQNIYSGESNISSLNCGHLCSLTHHFREEYNQRYMITRVVHHGRQDIESWGKVGGTRYHNEFSCIPSTLPYRPQRLTPKPKLYGIMNGVIDSEQDMDRADIDELGRYKVQMPFDISGSAPGKASRRIRMAQPYGGGGAGMSFPLVKGTEVIWTCIDGDIDRPIITGAVPNPMNPSVTTHENNTSNVIKTMSGITMGFHDGSGSAGQNTTGGGAGGGLAAQRQFQNNSPGSEPLKQTQSRSKQIPATRAELIPAQQEASPGYSLELQQQMINNRVDLGGKKDSNNATQWSIGIPYHSSTSEDEQDRMRDTKDIYLRLGAASLWEKEDWGGAWGKDGMLSYVDGERNLVTMGDDNHWHYGGSSDYYKSPQFSCFNDINTEFYLGMSYDFRAGLIGEVTAGFKTAINVAAEVEINAGVKASFGYVGEYNSVLGRSITLADSFRRESNSTVDLVCDPEDDWKERIKEQIFPPVAAAVGGLVVVSGITASADEGAADSGNAAAITTQAATHTLGIVCAAIALSNIKQDKADGASKMHMDPENIDLILKGVEVDTPATSPKYKPANPKKISIHAKQGNTDPTAVEINMEREGSASKKGSITLKTGKTLESQIVLKGGETVDSDGEITLKVGESSIIIKNNGIEFKAPFYEFKVGAAQKLVIKDKLWSDLPVELTKALKITGNLDVKGTPKGEFKDLTTKGAGAGSADSR